jgi:hypothetical protein
VQWPAAFSRKDSQYSPSCVAQLPHLTRGDLQTILSKSAILLAKVINDLQLVLVHPAGDGDQQESPPFS